jgi:sterol desaturase/sphingolipid hydroxylase (fatty acid hydroxylase superfamily)
MLGDNVRKKVRDELESPAERRRFGTGWISGVAALLAAFACLCFVLCLRFPDILTVPQIRSYYEQPLFRLGLQLLLVVAFVLAIISLMLRVNKVLGFSAIFVVLLASLLGGAHAQSNRVMLAGGIFFGLDWFVLNVVLTGILFIPLERLFPHMPDQHLFRTEWREDLFYYFVSSLFVQVLTFLALAPASAIASHTSWTALRGWVGAQWWWLQVLQIMFLTDLVQYWVHRAFHRVPFLWGFHAVHHSARSMDWMAAARMHFLEIIVLRGTTVIPMMILGFSEFALHVYILLVYVHSALLHSNVRWEFNRIGNILATPRFHHWHHGIEKEAIDVNFAIHFPLFDRLFGTFYLPRAQWPQGYGIANHPVPRSYLAQFIYPFRRALTRQKKAAQGD